MYDHILDCTLRDGWYVTKGGFSEDTIREYCQKSEECGFKYIEVGHGYGLNGELFLNSGDKIFTESQIKIAKEVVKTSKIGVFANAGICDFEAVDRAVVAGMDFIRIGFIGFDSPHPFSQLLYLIDYINSKYPHIIISVNMVKSHILSEGDFDRISMELNQRKTDILVLVDSSGYYTPNMIASKIRYLKSRFNGRVGFHGHNNSGLANINAFTALQNGADIIDGTVLGVGRDSGNSSLEGLINLFEKEGMFSYEKWTSLYDLISFIASNKEFAGYSFAIKPEEVLLGKYGYLTHGMTIAKSLLDNNRDLIKFFDYISSENLKITFESREIFESIIKRFKDGKN